MARWGGRSRLIQMELTQSQSTWEGAPRGGPLMGGTIIMDLNRNQEIQFNFKGWSCNTVFYLRDEHIACAEDVAESKALKHQEQGQKSCIKKCEQ